jgi:hypothetical protein
MLEFGLTVTVDEDSLATWPLLRSRKTKVLSSNGSSASTLLALKGEKISRKFVLKEEKETLASA